MCQFAHLPPFVLNQKGQRNHVVRLPVFSLNNHYMRVSTHVRQKTADEADSPLYQRSLSVLLNQLILYICSTLRNAV